MARILADLKVNMRMGFLGSIEPLGLLAKARLFSLLFRLWANRNSSKPSFFEANGSPQPLYLMTIDKI
ncbi:MAG TPA: hypothetical protein DIT25_02405 [Candidatus Moranbacteria bacterium]|nr:hypothetical protein [Candidatus Moranbacteria bacterium]